MHPDNHNLIDEVELDDVYRARTEFLDDFRSVDPDVIHRLSELLARKLAPGDGCIVCLEDLGETDVVACLLSCGNWVHKECQEGWLRRGHSTCMICKGEWVDVIEAVKEQEDFDSPDLKKETKRRIARLELKRSRRIFLGRLSDSYDVLLVFLTYLFTNQGERYKTIIYNLSD
jgi:hypothetical protein